MLAIAMAAAIGLISSGNDCVRLEREAELPHAELLHPVPLPDPYVWKDAGQWFIYGTNGSPAEFHSLQGTRLEPGFLREQPFQISYPGHQDLMIWGFHPYRDADGKYHAVGTIHLGYFKTEIAYFDPLGTEVTSLPPTRWRFVRTLVPYEEGKRAAYESKILHDGPDTYLMYCCAAGLGNDVSIFLQKMRGNGEIDDQSPAVVILKPEGLRSEDRNPGQRLQITEGPNIVQEGGKYLLFYSVGDFMLPNYKIGFAYSDSLVPKPGQTYRKVYNALVSPTNGGMREVHYLLQSENRERPNYIGDSVIAPGLANLVRDGGKSYLIFHGYKPTSSPLDPRFRYIWKLPVSVHVDDDRPPTEWIQPGRF